MMAIFDAIRRLFAGRVQAAQAAHSRLTRAARLGGTGRSHPRDVAIIAGVPASTAPSHILDIYFLGAVFQWGEIIATFHAPYAIFANFTTPLLKRASARDGLFIFDAGDFDFRDGLRHSGT